MNVLRLRGKRQDMDKLKFIDNATVGYIIVIDSYDAIYGKLRLTVLYLKDDYKFTKTHGLAKIFNTEQEAKLCLLDRFHYHHANIGIQEIDAHTKISIQKHKLRYKAKELFKLPVNTPAKILADRFEDANMLEEANLLRT